VPRTQKEFKFQGFILTSLLGREKSWLHASSPNVTLSKLWARLSHDLGNHTILVGLPGWRPATQRSFVRWRSG
jgi:hypothetical protein